MWLHKLCVHKLCLHKLCLHKLCLHKLYLHKSSWLYFNFVHCTFFKRLNLLWWKGNFIQMFYKNFLCPYHFLFKNWMTFSPGLIPANVNWACTGMSVFVDNRMSNNLSVVVFATMCPVIATTLSFVDLFSVIIRKKFLSTIVSSIVLTVSRSK